MTITMDVTETVRNHDNGRDGNCSKPSITMTETCKPSITMTMDLTETAGLIYLISLSVSQCVSVCVSDFTVCVPVCLSVVSDFTVSRSVSLWGLISLSVSQSVSLWGLISLCPGLSLCGV